MTSPYFKPSLLLLGESTQQMRKKGKFRNKVRPSEDKPEDDNGPVAFGSAFKWLK